MWFGKNARLTEEWIVRFTEGGKASGWTTFEATLLRVVDELHADVIISDSTWVALREKYSTQQLMDVGFSVGKYNPVSMALNTFGV